LANILTRSILATALILGVAPGRASEAPPINFARDIRPILSDNCFHCHGPDSAQRKGGIRLDTKEGAFAFSDGVALIAPGRPDGSELVRRIESSDPGEQMPPPEAKKKFGDAERALLRRWISEGAPWAEHWSLEPPRKPDPPAIADPAWARNPIDFFVAAQRDALALSPAPEADKRTLIRRISLDLTGLPPTPDEVEDFLADVSSDAYEKLVDRLLASPHYGERMAWPWLDAARYADTNGYQGDNERTMYPWRDWVVRAFNENMPYDQFTIEQLAGDLLPESTRDQRLATAFNRNHMINGEGGRIAEENRVEYVFDQLETVGTVWMGLTMNCARCHDHKYDPVTQDDYYRFFAFFNQTPVNGAGGDPRTAPILPVHSEETEARIAALNQEIASLDSALSEREAAIAPQQLEWEQAALAAVWENEKHWSVVTVREAKGIHQTLTVLDDGAVRASGDLPETDRYELSGEVNLPELRAIRLEALRYRNPDDGSLDPAGPGNFVLTNFAATLRHADGTEVPVTLESAKATYEQDGLPVANTFDDDPGTGWGIYDGLPVDRDHEAHFLLKEPLSLPPGSRLTFTLAFESQHARHILRQFRISASPRADLPLIEARHDVAKVLRTPPEYRSPEDAARLLLAYHESDQAHRQARRARQTARNALNDIDAKAVKVMVMEDQAEPRETFILRTGLYNQPMGAVTAEVPGFLFDMPADAPRNRLGLARWLMDPQHPLTARVTVNRFWGEIFGQGLVKTAENFGSQGEKPSHPELLDWLAVTFVESGWDVKALLRLMVTSAAYRQASDTDAIKLAADPDNRYLARGPRFRMPSWMIRDQALFASGLMVGKLGGPPVKPYQPDGLWQEFSFGNLKYETGTGEDLYRRSLYTFWRRIVAPPMFFDSSTRQTCSVKAPRTNTPLHALATLNDPTYAEAARALAERVLRMPDTTDEVRIDTAFRIGLARPAGAEELALLRHSVARLKQEFAIDPVAARAYLAVGDSEPAAGIDTVEHAAYAALCLSILNTDEALTKE
jgi:hypothetical protein